ncbi:AAA family ATPase [Lachnospira sp.]|jgi:ABC-type cobalamin/Fe3+-siderophores transport system ATPase subunit|uniref:AAA family ATPase n=1 Tax=Lachnospira sp. TaxID=2049031 RepID=UPI00257AE2F1|nr:AAA family ATPase [Lachnospira sp.]
MKILKISADGLMLFNDKVSIDFFAEQRVIKDNSDMLSNAFKNVYTNNVISVVGINASGKTSVLKLISFALELINGQSLNNIVNRDVLTDSKKVNIEVIFYDDNNNLYKLQSEIISVRNNEIDNRFIFGAEKIWKKSISKIQSKKDIVSYENTNLFKERDNTAEFLSDDVSIAIAISKNNKIFVRDLLNYTNMNMIRLIGNYPHELIKFLDPSIESITFDKNNSEIKLKFYGKDAISLSDPLQCEKYLSSGTVKGLNVFLNAMMVFNKGGYLLVDELENHFNREIVATLYRFFTNPIVNKMGATIIFSTHYSELLDEFERSDNIYIVRNKNGISAEKLCNLLKRNDIKKSEAFKSGYLEGTAPLYESYIDLKEVIINSRTELGVH